MLTANQIYNKKVVKYNTPFAKWLTFEKANFEKRHNIKADDNKNKFDVYLNRRYNMANDNFWEKQLSVLGIEDNWGNENVKNDIEDNWGNENVKNDIEDNWGNEKITTDEPLSAAISIKKSVPFLKRKIIGMKVSNALIGLGILTALISGTIIIKNYYKKNK